MAEPQFLHHARPKIFRNDICARDQLFCDFQCGRVLEIQTDTFLVAIGDKIKRRLSTSLFGIVPTPVALKGTLNRLNSYDFCTKVSKKLYTEWPHEKVVEADNADALQWHR